MPKDPAPSTRGRGSYAVQACNICRSKKIKCDGVKPVCASCGASGREGECSWGRDVPVRKPRSEAHFEALRRRTDALQAYASMLEGMLARCVCQDVSAHLQSHPDRSEEGSGVDGSDSDTDLLDSDEEYITQELCVPTQALKLDDKSGGLLRLGITAPMRFGTRLPPEVTPVAPVVEDPNRSYVLLVDGVDTTGYDPDFDWSRYLPCEVPLKRREHDKILDIAFKFFTMFCLRLVPCLFLRDMHRALSVPRGSPPPKTPYYSPMLHNALVGVSAVFSDDPRIRDPKSRRYFITASKSHFEEECQKPDISLVHALGLLGSYHGCEGEPVLGDLYYGMGARISQALGLEVDSSDWVKAGLITSEEKLVRNWTHWTIFSVDLLWALYFGRDYCSPPMDRPAIPLPFVDVDFDQTPWYHAPANLPAQPNFLSLTFSASTSLLLIARKIVDVVNGLRRCARDDVIQNENLITEIDLELNTWKSQLPPELDITFSNRVKSTPQRLILHCTYWWCFIVLHRPFFNRRARPIQSSDRGIDHVKLCKRAAENIMELLEAWSSLYTLRYTPPTILQLVFGAGTVFLLLTLQATSSLRVAQGSLNASLAHAELCVQYLSEIGASWRAAARTGDILRSLLEDRLKPILARRMSHEGLPPSEIQRPSPPAGQSHQVRPRVARAPESECLRPPPPLPSDVPAPAGAAQQAEARWTRPEHTYGTADQAPQHSPRRPFDLSEHAEPDHDAGILDTLASLDGRTFLDLDTSDFLLPAFDSFGSADVWEDGAALEIRRSDLGVGTGYTYNNTLY